MRIITISVNIYIFAVPYGTPNIHMLCCHYTIHLPGVVYIAFIVDFIIITVIYTAGSSQTTRVKVEFSPQCRALITECVRPTLL